MIEGLPLDDLANNPDVLEMLGGTAPTPGHRPSEVLDISAIRVGKSLFAAALIFWLSQTVDLSGTTQSDIVRIFVVALKLGGTDAVMTHLVVNLLNKPKLTQFLVEDPKEITVRSARNNGLKLWHGPKKPGRKIIEVSCIPLDRAGGSGLSVYAAGVIVDEYPRMIGADDGVRNVEHFRDGVMGRLVPGAIYLATGSPWQPYGPAYDAVIQHFGKPTQDLLVLRTTGKANPHEWTDKKRERLKRTNPRAYKTDYEAQFMDGEEAVFPAVAIEDAWNRPVVFDAEYGKPAIFADPSALRHDYWAAMVAGWVYPRAAPEDIYECQLMGESILPGPPGSVMRGREGWIRILEDVSGRPIPKRDGTGLKPWLEVYDIVSWDKASGARGLDLVKAVGALGKKYGCEDFHWDGYEQLMLADLVRQEGLRPVIHTWNGANRKTDAVDHLRTLFIERRIRLVQHTLLKQELLRFRSRATPGGNFQYIVAGGAGHGDHASCLTLASRADLDGYVDRSPTVRTTARHEVLDYDDEDEEYQLLDAA